MLACFFARDAGFGEVRNVWERTVFFPIVFVGFGFGFGFGLATPRQKGLPLLSFSNTLLQFSFHVTSTAPHRDARVRPRRRTVCNG